jgi:ankyrin repeat protein
MQIKNILGQTTRGQVIGALKALPIGLAENIGLTVKRIKSQHPQSIAQATLAMNVLLWLSHAKRSLKVSELQHAVAIRPEEICIRDMHDPDFFVYYCFGLVVIEEETSIIRLVHFSVNEYLQKHCSEFFPNADDLLTCSCISYMFMHESVLNRRLCFGILPVADDEAPFLTYAARYWGIHASNSVLSKTQKEVQLFCSRREFHAWARVLDIDVVKKDTIDELEAQYVNASSSVLHAAAVYGLNYLVEEYLRKCLPVNTTDYEKATPLMLAAACGRTDILKRQLAQPDIDAHRVDMEQHTALWYAVYRGQAKCVQILLLSGFDLDINRGKPFSLASGGVGKSAQYGEIVSLLLSQNDLDSNCGYDNSVSAPPWYYLAIGWELDLLRRLVSRPDFDPWRRTPPVKLWPKFTQFIAETDYDYFLVDESWIRKVADLPAIFNLLDADERFCLPEFDMLFLMWPFVYYAFGEDIPYEDADEGRTYSYKIDWMLIWDDTNWTWRSILRRSLEANQLSLHTKDSKNRGFIHYLARQGKEEYLKFILQKGVAIDYKDSLGRTALYYAASKGHKKACDILINAGANPHSVDNDGRNILHLACSSGKLDMVNRLIDLGADVHAKDRYGSTTLHYASMSKEGGPIIELLVRGLRLNVNISTNMGQTPLHTAANRPTVARILLDLGADPNVCGDTGTALSDAIFAGNKTVADMLALDTDLEIPDCLGRTPRSELQFLFKDHRLGGAEQRYTEPANLRVHRDVVLSYLRKRLKGMLDGDDNTHTFYGAALMLLEVGDEVSAQVMLEHGISPFSNYDTLYWQKLGCGICDGNCGYLYIYSVRALVPQAT